MTHFIVAICTAKRPAMLAATLESIVNLAVPNGGTLSVVIIENDRAPRSRDVVERIQAMTHVPLKYYLEPKIGIPYARNRSVVAALAEDADWIAMIDDDETAEPDWLVQLYDACKTYETDVATGSVRQIPEVPPPHWWKPLSSLGKPTGFLRRDAYTNNVLFHSKLIRADGFALRFDDRLTFGADDVDFFRRANTKGARIVTVADAVVTESVPASRLSLHRVLKRTFMVSAANAFLGVLRDGRTSTILTRVPSIIRRFVVGVFLLGAGLPVLLIERIEGEKMLFKGASSLTKACGSMYGLIGGTSSYYSTVDGA
jgi:succinoglycan biosynthesis protein ExoM